MASRASDGSDDFEFIETPRAPTPPPPETDCGVRITSVSALSWTSFPFVCNRSFVAQYPTIKNAPLPADGAGADSFNNGFLISLLVVPPAYLAFQAGGGLFVWLLFVAGLALPVLMVFWSFSSRYSPRVNEKARFPGRPVEHYIDFARQSDRIKFRGRNKIPMETFSELYFDGHVKFKGDALNVLEYRHDWASFGFTASLFRYFLLGMVPEVLMHTRSQGQSFVKNAVRVNSRIQTRSKSVITMTAVMTSTAGSLDRA